jgi:acyl-CoA reductase-like NAD-dependent aldehyde dehydrogenase
MSTRAGAASATSRNPATLEVIGSVELTAPRDAAAIVGEVAGITPLWAQLRVGDRARYLERAAQAVIDEFEELATAIAAESGRPLVEIAACELLAAIDTLQWLARNARELLSARPFSLPRAIHPLKRASAGHSPLGVVGVIGAGSSPFAGLLAQTGAALLAGNGVVVKPALRSAQAGERIAGVLSRAGFPEGVVRVLQGEPELAGALAQCRDVAHVSFAGGAHSAAEVAAACASRGATSSLDIAASEAMVVLADASLEGAVAGALWAAFAGAGQLHGSLQRVYVERELHDAFVDALAAAASSLRIGDPLQSTTELGPLVSAERRALVEQTVATTCAAGAQRRNPATLPQLPELPGAFCAPVVLSGSSAQLAPLQEFIPGPLVGVCAVEGPVEAVALENAAARGARGASIWSADRRHAARIARELRARVVWCNDHLVGPVLPREAADGVAACVSPKLITWDPSGSRLPWRFPYDTTSARAIRALVALHSSRPGDRERALRGGVPAIARVAGRALRSGRP